MPSPLEMLKSRIHGSAVTLVSQRLRADQHQTQLAIGAALPVLLGALAGHASRPDGAAALHEALVRDHDGSALTDVSGALNRADLTEGKAILGHILGTGQRAVETGVSAVSGLDAHRVGELLATLAPVVMGALATLQRQQHLDASGLAGALKGEQPVVRPAAPKLGGLLVGRRSASPEREAR